MRIYKEKDGSFQQKKIKCKVIFYDPADTTIAVKVCSVKFDISKYAGLGVIKDLITLRKEAMYWEFIIHVEKEKDSSEIESKKMFDKF